MPEKESYGSVVSLVLYVLVTMYFWEQYKNPKGYNSERIEKVSLGIAIVNMILGAIAGIGILGAVVVLVNNHKKR
jgi:hypothetical protein